MSNNDQPLEGGWRELLIVVVASAALTVAITYPWVFRIGHAARVDSFDGQFSIWNVAWVARTLIADPLHLFDANIFYPHRGTLLYSEANLGAGVLAVPVYWITKNPYIAHDSVVFMAFMLSSLATYYLVRYLFHDRRAAAISAICFAFCPFVFARTTQIQLLLPFGIPLSMLACHRLIDRPGAGRAVALGAAMACQTFFCAYYGVFVVLMVAFSVLVAAVAGRRWRDGRYWATAGLAFGVAALLILPLFVPYLLLQRDTGFARPLSEARQWSSDWRSYFASSAYAHLWMLRVIDRWSDVDFPGFVATLFGAAGAWVGWRLGGRSRELVAMYGGLVVLALWASFGPDAGLYGVLYRTVPAFTMMRAPSRFGLVVAFGLAVLTTLAVRGLLRRVPMPSLVAGALALATAAELAIGLEFQPIPPPSPAFDVLAARPSAPLIEMPLFSGSRVIRHARYMLNSTAHWMPIVDGFSDWIPPDFVANAPALGTFPSRAAFTVLHPDVRYALFHLDAYDAPSRAEVEARLVMFDRCFRLLYADEQTRLYEIVSRPS